MPEPVVEEKVLPSVLLLMTVVTGLVDAVSYLGLGKVFTANMTGNVIIMAFAAARTPGLSIERSLSALILFLAGSIAGGRLAMQMEAKGRRTWTCAATGLEAILLFIAALLAYAAPAQMLGSTLYGIIMLTAFSMGIRNSTVRRLGVRDLTTTVLTLTISGLAADSSLAGGTNPHWERRAGSVLMLFLGALVGAVLVRHSLPAALLVPSLIMAGCTLALYLYMEPALAPGKSQTSP